MMGFLSSTHPTLALRGKCFNWYLLAVILLNSLKQTKAIENQWLSAAFVPKLAIIICRLSVLQHAKT
jgi:hypothetical protein